MSNDIFSKLADKYPFITLCVYASQEYVGIIQNKDDAITTIYDFGSIQDTYLKQQFLELANVWWWESNRSIPINIFLKSEWDPFKVYLKTFVNKDLEIIHGPACSLIDMSRKKSKRKSITLVRRLDQ
ncbi:hypothetical protein UFOVP328_321 [uncultured Caudovirales phage]|uniref:Uncharacterized protein n=1 Tax=uncultured Caudovirales phage TaxID=2100421 RepID=A0A6J5LUL8_9CAUD|nr:hypothetical protein UFOVP328_321 [uncultured Caudovirales phage]